jgi:hypothetical protein
MSNDNDTKPVKDGIDRVAEKLKQGVDKLSEKIEDTQADRDEARERVADKVKDIAEAIRPNKP